MVRSRPLQPRPLALHVAFNTLTLMAFNVFPDFVRKNYELHQWRHACAILATDFPSELADLIDVLERFRLKKSYINVGGKNKSQISAWIDGALTEKGWLAKCFDTRIVVDGHSMDSPTHEVDCFKNRVALEIEWNNKDPFFDRDLNNFRLLFDLRVVSVGVIITRCDELQGVFNELGRGPSYGMSTTHMSKLLPRIEGGSGAGCPILVVGIRRSLYAENS